MRWPMALILDKVRYFTLHEGHLATVVVERSHGESATVF